MGVTDSNSVVELVEAFRICPREGDVLSIAGVRSIDGSGAMAHVPAPGLQVQGRLQCSDIPLSKSVSLHGLRLAYLPAKSAGYRGMHAFSVLHALPHRRPRQHHPFQLGRRQRERRRSGCEWSLVPFRIFWLCVRLQAGSYRCWGHGHNLTGQIAQSVPGAPRYLSAAMRMVRSRP